MCTRKQPEYHSAVKYCLGNCRRTIAATKETTQIQAAYNPWPSSKSQFYQEKKEAIKLAQSISRHVCVTAFVKACAAGALALQLAASSPMGPAPCQRVLEGALQPAAGGAAPSPCAAARRRKQVAATNQISSNSLQIRLPSQHQLSLPPPMRLPCPDGS